MAVNAPGYLRPAVSPTLDAALEARALAACPGANLEGAGAPERGRAPVWDAIWGPVGRLARGHASDRTVRHVSGSGGVITALCLQLLESGEAEAILHVAAEAAAPLRTLPRISLDREALLDSVGARYGPAAPLAGLEPLLASGRRFAFVGKPCDVSALRLLARQDPRIDKALVATISFFCGGVPSLAIARSIVGKYGLAEDEVEALRWRGHGCPGMTHIRSRDGAIFEQSYDETWGDALNQEIQFRCKVCPDAVGLAADLVCGDAWVTRDGYAHEEYEGWNAVIGRTPRGLALLAEAEAAGALRLEPLTLDELGRMQPHHVERRGAVPARLLALRCAGQPAPRGRRLGLLRAAWTGRRHLLRNFLGTLRRVRRGRNREPLPERG
jgi:coenzyme F420 hydrogenase subunit beta